MRQYEREQRIATLEAAHKIAEERVVQRQIVLQIHREQVALRAENDIREEYGADLREEYGADPAPDEPSALVRTHDADVLSAGREYEAALTFLQTTAGQAHALTMAALQRMNHSRTKDAYTVLKARDGDLSLGPLECTLSYRVSRLERALDALFDCRDDLKYDIETAMVYGNEATERLKEHGS